MPHFKIYSFVEEIQRCSSQLIQMVLTELFRVSDGLPNRSFCWSDISRVQLKSNWTVCKKLLVSYSKTFCKSRLVLSKAQLIFFNGWFGNCIISKELTLKAFLYDVMLRSGNCSDIQMALRTDHFADWIFRGSNWSPTEELVKAC